MDPLVSVPIVIAHILPEAAAPEPALEPQGFRSKAKGFLVCLPLPLHPLEDREDLKLAPKKKMLVHADRVPEIMSAFASMFANLR